MTIFSGRKFLCPKSGKVAEALTPLIGIDVIAQDSENPTKRAKTANFVEIFKLFKKCTMWNLVWRSGRKYKIFPDSDSYAKLLEYFLLALVAAYDNERDDHTGEKHE